MAITPARFQLTHIDPNQMTPTVTANEALNELDTGVNATVDVDVNAGGTITLSNDDYRQYMEFNLRGDLGSPDGPLADFTLEIPSGTSGAFFVTNTTAFNCEVQTAGIGSPQVSVNVAPGDTVWCFSDGTNVVAAGGQDGAAGAPGADGTDGTDGVSTVRAQNYETFRAGTLSDNQVIHRWIFAKQTTFAADFANSYAFAGIVPTGAVTLRIMQGDSGSPSPTQVGSIDFGAGGEWGTFTMTGSPTEATTIQQGQYVEIQGPGPADATLADLSINLQGSGTNQLLFHVQDQKADGTGGGNASATTWHKRDLNTILTNEIPGASLSNNEITLPAGDYYVEAIAPSFQTQTHIARIEAVDASPSETLVWGMNAYGETTETVVTYSHVQGRFSLSVATNIQLQHFTTAAKAAGVGFGVAVASLTANEIYSDVRIWKIE